LFKRDTNSINKFYWLEASLVYNSWLCKAFKEAWLLNISAILLNFSGEFKYSFCKDSSLIASVYNLFPSLISFLLVLTFPVIAFIIYCALFYATLLELYSNCSKILCKSLSEVSLKFPKEILLYFSEFNIVKISSVWIISVPLKAL
jgi:hypothetical protein